MADREALPNALIQQFAKMGFDLVDVDPDDAMVKEALVRKHHKSSSAVTVLNEKIDSHSVVKKRW